MKKLQTSSGLSNTFQVNFLTASDSHGPGFYEVLETQIVNPTRGQYHVGAGCQDFLYSLFSDVRFSVKIENKTIKSISLQDPNFCLFVYSTKYLRHKSSIPSVVSITLAPDARIFSILSLVMPDSLLKIENTMSPRSKSCVVYKVFEA